MLVCVNKYVSQSPLPGQERSWLALLALRALQVALFLSLVVGAVEVVTPTARNTLLPVPVLIIGFVAMSLLQYRLMKPAKSISPPKDRITEIHEHLVVVIMSDGDQGGDADAEITTESVLRSRRLRDRFSSEDLQAMIDLYRSGATAPSRWPRSTVSACAASSGCCTSMAYAMRAVPTSRGVHHA